MCCGLWHLILGGKLGALEGMNYSEESDDFDDSSEEFMLMGRRNKVETDKNKPREICSKIWSKGTEGNFYEIVFVYSRQSWIEPLCGN